MQLTMKPYATAGVALVGASVIAVSAVAPHPQVHLSALPEASTRSVEVALRDLANPFAALNEVLQTTIQNIDQLGTTILADPAPILTGMLTGTAHTAVDTLGILNANLHTALTGGLGTVVGGAVSHTGAALGVLGSSAVQAIPGALASTVQLLNTLGALGAGTVGALFTTTPADLRMAIQQIQQGDLGDALQSVVIALTLDPLLGTNANNSNLFTTLLKLAAGPFTTVAKVLQAGGLNALAAPLSTMANIIQNAGPSMLSGVVLGAVGTMANLAYAVGDGLQKVANGVASLNLGKIYNGLVKGLAEVGTAVSNTLLSPNLGVGIPGILLNIRDTIAAYLPKTSPYKGTTALAAATPSAAAIPSATSTGVTITPISTTITSTKSNTSTKSSPATSDAGSDDTVKSGTAASDTGSDDTVKSGTEKSGTAKSGTEKSGTEKSGTAKSGGDKSGKGKSRTEKSGSTTSATGKSGSGHSGHRGHGGHGASRSGSK